jgi:hypothetical protein
VVGKVVFKADAWLRDHIDAYAAASTAQSLPIKLRK